jgi:hypothetical protein
MKALILTAAAMIFFAISCKKGAEPLNADLFGKWEVRRIYGGNIYPPDSTYAVGNSDIMQFNSDSTYMHYFHHTQNAQGVYHIRKNGFKINQATYDEIYFDSDTSFKSLISLNNSTLTIMPLMPDIATTDYQKISD